MNQNIKFFVSAGCSFSAVPYFDGHISWPKYLATNIFKHAQRKHIYKMGCGNGLISKSLIYELSNALKTIKGKDMFVGIMWSDSNRLEAYFSKTTSLNYNYIDGGPGYQNPQNIKTFDEHNSIEENDLDRNYYMINPSFDDSISKNYYNNFFDDIGSKIQSLENILRVQWFLKLHEIPYVFMSMNDNVLPNESEKNYLNIGHLFDMLDLKNYIKKDLMSFSNESNLPFHPIDNMHPSGTQHAQFCEKIIVPHLVNKGFICE